MSTILKTPNLRVPPQNLDSEKALLGSIMLRPEVINDIADMIRAEAFYADKHRLIYNAMLDLFKKNEPIDIVSVSSILRDNGKLDQVGGSGYVAELANFVPSSANAEYYGSIIHKKFMMRNLILASEHLAHLGYEESGELDEILDAAEKKIFEITNVSHGKKFVEMKDTLQDAWERIDKLSKNKGEVRGVTTGFRDLDNKLLGLQNSDLIILAARPSMGKTSLALDIARKTAVEHGNQVAIFSLEMSASQLVDRMLAAQAGVDSWKIRTSQNLTEEDFANLQEGMDKLAKAPIYISDEPGNNILKMRSVARRLKNEKGLRLIIVDYLQLMTPIHSRGSDSMVNQVTELSRSLKNLAREFDVPVLALSQLSRAVEARGGEPRLSDLRDSGSIEQDADVVMFIHREDKYNKESDKPNIAKIMIEKHRNGPTGNIELYFNDKKTTFQTIDKSNFGAF
jgi:replicative DNA helicase